MSIELGKPYKIIARKVKKYEQHYKIPADKCVVIPLKIYGDDLSCDVRWEDSNGELQQQQQLFFNHENIEPLDEMKDYSLQEIWQHYYSKP
jgi:hypothetical protein